MSDLEVLFLVLALVYLSECLVWMRRGAMAFAAWWSRSCHVWHPGTLTGNHRGGLFLANPLPPFGSLFVLRTFPFSVSTEAAYAFSSSCLNPAGRASQTGAFLPWDKIQKVETDRRKVLVNGDLFLKAVSPFSARQSAEWLDLLRKRSKAERPAAIRKLIADALDTKRIAERLHDFRQRVRSIRLLSGVLFVYLFVVVPPVVWRYGFGQLGLWLILGVLAQTITIAVLSRRAHKALYPEADEERFKHFLTMLLAPPAAIRAPDVLGRHLLEPFHPLAVARIVCSPKRFRDFARQTMIDLRYPLFPVCPTTESAPVETERWFRETTLAAVVEFLQQEGLKVNELVAAPQPTELANLSYCPRCGTQFVTREGTCADCGERPLQTFQRG